jgi:hypothetical protein
MAAPPLYRGVALVIAAPPLYRRLCAGNRRTALVSGRYAGHVALPVYRGIALVLAAPLLYQGIAFVMGITSVYRGLWCLSLSLRWYLGCSQRT